MGVEVKTSGCCVNAACSAVVPAFGAPMTRKSGPGGLGIAAFLKTTLSLNIHQQE